jgi:hypothetical protein
MTAILLGRAALLVLALLAARRARQPRWALLAGAAGAGAAFGPAPVLPLEPLGLGVGFLAVAFLLVLLGASTHSPLASEAARAAAALVAGAAVVTALALHEAGAGTALLSGGAVGAGLSVFAAEGCRANAEAGWRRAVAWAGAVVLAGLVSAGLLAFGAGLPPRFEPAGPGVAFLVALVAWLPAFLLERRRVLRELSEEARLGILPVEDLATLGNPWRRSREARFGRADERSQYVRNALLLAVARQQQRRRSGEAIRLRQLEVLAFRTRVRRAVEGRSARFASASDELAV